MRKFLARSVLAAAGCLMIGSASAVPVTWTDWSRISGNSATGTMGGVTVTATGTANFDGVSQVGTGENFWTQPNLGDPAYTGGSVDNAPTANEQVGLSSANTVTVTFSTAIDRLYMALLSVGQPGLQVTYDFDRSFTVDSDGIGYWSFANGGNPGAYSLSAGDRISMNEFHGVLLFDGPVTNLTFNAAPNEFWHAFTFGSAAAVPEPGALVLVALGLLGLGFSRRKLA